MLPILVTFLVFGQNTQRASLKEWDIYFGSQFLEDLLHSQLTLRWEGNGGSIWWGKLLASWQPGSRVRRRELAEDDSPRPQGPRLHLGTTPKGVCSYWVHWCMNSLKSIVSLWSNHLSKPCHWTQVLGDSLDVNCTVSHSFQLLVSPCCSLWPHDSNLTSMFTWHFFCCTFWVFVPHGASLPCLRDLSSWDDQSY